MIDGTVAHQPAAGVVVVPTNAGDDDADGEQGSEPPHLCNENQRKRDAGHLHPGVEWRAEPGVIRFYVTLAHHDYGDVDETEQQQLQRACEFRHLDYIQHQEESDQQRGRQDRGMYGSAEAAEFCQSLREQMVARHGQRISRRGKDSGIRHRGEGGHRRRHDEHDTGLSRQPRSELARRIGDGSEALAERVGPEYSHHDVHTDDIHDDYRAQGEDHPERNVTIRMFHLFRQTRDLCQSDIGHEHEPHGTDQPVHTFRKERGELRSMCLNQTLRHHGNHAMKDEKAQDGKHREHQNTNQPGGLLGTQNVEDCEHYCERYCQRLDRYIPDEREICAHPYQGKRALEDQGDPGTHPPYRSHQWPERSV